MSEEITEKPTIVFTEAAIVAVKAAFVEAGSDPTKDFLRVSVIGGSCAGYQYNLDFSPEVREDDTEIDLGGGFKALLDSISVGYLSGTVIDYHSGLNGTGFKFNNPTAKRTCGCGSSFSV